MRTLYAPLRGHPWKYSAVEQVLTDRAVRRAAARHRLDAILAVADVDTPTVVPTFLYQDMNAAVAFSERGSAWAQYVNTLPTTPALLRRRGDRQVERAKRATAVFAMSQWYADRLVNDHGISPAQVHVVPAGMNNPPDAYRSPAAAPCGRVLFVGADFFRKGGDLVVEAVRQLRKVDDGVRLTVAGPRRWPMATEPPSWIDFRGVMSPADVSALYPVHDVFAMPSRFEAFGIALAEALVAGLPCVARDAFAMPEIVEDPAMGALVSSDDPSELAAALERVLSDDAIHQRVAAARPRLLRRHTWAGAAATMLGHIAAATR